MGARIERIVEKYKWSDLIREAHGAERDRLKAELGTLRAATRQVELLVQAATLLKDLPVASEAATSAQCSALTTLAFASMAITDDRVAAVVPQPSFGPFFQKPEVDEGLLEANSNGATWMTPSSEVMNGRKRRGSVTRDRCCDVAFSALLVFRATGPFTSTI
jgi:hypothetical protein